jgi:hypothetical protein
VSYGKNFQKFLDVHTMLSVPAMIIASTDGVDPGLGLSSESACPFRRMRSDVAWKSVANNARKLKDEKLKFGKNEKHFTCGETTGDSSSLSSHSNSSVTTETVLT